LPEPRTHYQLSFTSRQAVLFFGIFLAALAGAYFLGIATGIAGRPQTETAAASRVTPSSESAALEKPARRAASPTPAPAPAAAPETRAPAVAAREPSAAQGIQFFDDRPEEPTPPAPSPGPARKASSPSVKDGYWVQVLSTTSQSEANSRRVRLSGQGFRATVSPVRGAKGPALYRVRVGPYASREEASKASETLARKERVRTWIVPPGE